MHRAFPGVVVLLKRLRRGRAFCRDHAFECREPMAVVGFSGIGIAGAWAFLISSPSIADHSVQAKRPFSCSASAIANAWASQGARKTGPFASRGTPGSASAARRAVSGSMDDDSDMFEIRLKRFD